MQHWNKNMIESRVKVKTYSDKCMMKRTQWNYNITRHDWFAFASSS